MALLDELAARLVAQGVGILGTNIFLSSTAIIPTGSGPYLTLNETGGFKPALTQNNTATQRPTVQLLARATSYPLARALLYAAYAALGGQNGLWNTTLSGVQYLKILARQEPTDMGLDGSSRSQIVFNIDVEKQPS